MGGGGEDVSPAREEDVIEDRVPFGYRRVTTAEKKRLVQEQFDPIARTYDLADALLSFGLDSLWRRKAVRLLDLRPGDRLLDACGGTAGLARLAARRIGPSGRVIVYDFNRRMMETGKRKLGTDDDAGPISFVQGDAEDLGLPDGAFDAVTISFGIRNLAHPDRGLDEFSRVLRPGGRLMILEFSLPVNPVLRVLYHLYSFYWMPFAGRLICGTGASFRYLAESIRVFPSPDNMAVLIRRAGFTDVRFLRLTNGIAVAYFGTKPEVRTHRPARPPAPSREGDPDGAGGKGTAR
jgi:demethylmenaquinone methyltransferase/2-methoxy-6-polyprenyl-1,4-benzoquinol methylase